MTDLIKTLCTKTADIVVSVVKLVTEGVINVS